MAKRVVLAVLFSLCALLLFGCTQPSEPAQEGKLKVVATFYPLADFSRNIGGNRVEVATLIPPGAEPHEFEPSPSTIRQLNEADVLIYNGAELEPWLPNLIEGIDNNGLRTVDTSMGIRLIEGEDEHEHEHEGEDVDEDESHGHGAHDHGHGAYDPHFWLSPPDAKTQVANIRDAFVQADPAGKEYYEANAAAYTAKLDALDAKFRSTMADCRKRDILITHSTLAYFCREYGCNQIPITGVSPEAEPSPASLARIIGQAKARNVSVVFFESMIDPRSAEVIAREINGSVSVFNTVHGLTADEAARGEDYLSLMEGNMERIKAALECN